MSLLPASRSLSMTILAVAASSSQVVGHLGAVLVEQVLAVVERRRVGEERQRDQLAVDGLRLDDRREMLRRRRPRSPRSGRASWLASCGAQITSVW